MMPVTNPEHVLVVTNHSIIATHLCFSVLTSIVFVEFEVMILTNPAHNLVVTNHSNTLTQALQHIMIQTNSVRNYISVTNAMDLSKNQSLKPKLLGTFPFKLGKRDLQALAWIFEKSFLKMTPQVGLADSEL